MRRSAGGAERDAKEAEIRAEVERFRAQAIEAGGLYIIGTSGTKAAASIISCVAAPAARAIPDARNSSFR